MVNDQHISNKRTDKPNSTKYYILHNANCKTIYTNWNRNVRNNISYYINHVCTMVFIILYTVLLLYKIVFLINIMFSQAAIIRKNETK